MDARFYNSEDIDIERLATDMVNMYISQGYQAQQVGNKDQVLIQLKKGGDFEAIIGMQAAVSLTLQRTAGGVLAMIGQQKWIDKAAVGAVGIVAFPVLWPLALTAGVGTLRQASLGNQVLNMVDGLVRQQRPNIVGGPIPAQLLPQVQNQWGQGQPNYNQAPLYIPSGQQQPPAYIPPPQNVVSAPQPAAPAAPKQTLHCPNCNTPYEPGDTFCSGCGRSLTPVKETCPNCGTELKPGVAFCPKCGTSTFQAKKSAAAPQTPVYTPPAQPPAQPAFVPPPVPPSRPPTPVYTPPPTPVYTPPAQPTIEPHAAPTVAAQPAAAPKPPEPLYVPPKTQNPEVQPPTRINYVPSNAPKQETPPPPPRPEKQYYIPSNQAQQAASQPTIPAQPPVAKAEQKPAVDPNFVWGIISFSDGSQVDLKGERAIVGRADHDLEGEAPEVDLSQKQGADTVSRIHAVIEHSGSSYSLTDLNSTNATRLNGKRLEPDKAAPLNDGDSLQFGKITATFKKM